MDCKLSINDTIILVTIVVYTQNNILNNIQNTGLDYMKAPLTNSTKGHLQETMLDHMKVLLQQTI